MSQTISVTPDSNVVQVPNVLENKEFLYILKQRLKTGDSRSVHLNALTGKYLTRLDLASFELIKENTARRFLNTLLSKPDFKFEVSLKDVLYNIKSDEVQRGIKLLVRKLNALYNEDQDNFLEYGVRSFSFGYPLLVKRDKQNPNKVIKAPLLIWSLNIERSFKQADTWYIKRDEELPVRLNDVLLAHLEQDENVCLKSLQEQYFEDAMIDEPTLKKVCRDVMRQLNFNKVPFLDAYVEEHFSKPISKVPEQKEADDTKPNAPWVSWSGVFGLFKTQKESIINDIDKLIHDFDKKYQGERLSGGKFQKTTFAAVPADPSQEHILNNLYIGQDKVIQGPPGTGKSQTITAIVSNALINKTKCLVVCEKKTALDVIKANLDKIGLGELCVIIEDIYRDRKTIVDSVRNRIDQSEPVDEHRDVVYESLEAKCNLLKERLLKQHELLGANLLGGDNWTNLVGKYIKCSEKEDKSILDVQLNPDDFEFKTEELNRLQSYIKEAEPLFKKVNTLKHPLESLDERLFKQDNLNKAELELKKQLKDFAGKLQKLIKEIDKTTKSYKEEILTEYNDHFRTLHGISTGIKRKIREKTTEHGKLFNVYSDSNAKMLKYMSVLGGKYKKLIAEKDQILADFQYVQETCLKRSYLKFDFYEPESEFKFDKLLENIAEFQRVLGNWKEQSEAIVNDYVTKLTSEHLHPGITVKAKIQKLEQQFDSLVLNVNSANIFNFKWETDKETIPEKRLHLQKVLDHVQHLLNNMDDFRNFFEWKSFLVTLSGQDRKTLTGLAAVNPAKWWDNFYCWYLFWLLSKHEAQRLPGNDSKITELDNELKQLRSYYSRGIYQYWKKKQQDAVERFKNKNAVPLRNLYNIWGSKGNKRNSLRKIVATDFDLFTDFFPVVLVNPTVCSSIVPLKEGLFDFVIFDEASQLRLEDTYCALFRGKYRIVSGDSQQMPPSTYFQSGEILVNPDEEEPVDVEEMTTKDIQKDARLNLAESNSLLEYAENAGYEPSYLDFHYRSQHPYLIDFSNIAFYGKRLRPMPEKSKEKPIYFRQVRGIYEDHVNKDEARKVIEILKNRVRPDNKGNMPTVGIATFNIYQRNLILDEIRNECLNDLTFAGKVEILFKRGMFVKNLENIQGDERDIMIISTTFGKRKDDTFLQNFGPINRKEGYKLLNVIITRAKQHMYLCTSIPSDVYGQYPQEIRKNGLTGKGILYAFLAYCKAIEKDDQKVRTSILGFLEQSSDKQLLKQSLRSGREMNFERLVAGRLSKHIAPERIHLNYRFAGFPVDIMIEPLRKGEKQLVIECDGSKDHKSAEAYAMDIFRQEQLEAHGMKFHRVWSKNWWINPEKELKELVELCS